MRADRRLYVGPWWVAAWGMAPTPLRRAYAPRAAAEREDSMRGTGPPAGGKGRRNEHANEKVPWGSSHQVPFMIETLDWANLSSVINQ